MSVRRLPIRQPHKGYRVIQVADSPPLLPPVSTPPVRPAISYIDARVTPPVIRRSRVVQAPIVDPPPRGGGFRGSIAQIVGSPGYYDAVQNPPVVARQKHLHKTSGQPPLIIPRKARGGRGNYDDLAVKRGCCDACCNTCPWWLWALFGLLFLLCILGGLLLTFRERLGGIKEKFVVVKDKLEEGLEKLKQLVQRAFAKSNVTDEKNQRDSKNEVGNRGSRQNKGSQSSQAAPFNEEPQQPNSKRYQEKGQSRELKLGSQPKTQGEVNKRQLDVVTITNITCQSGYFFHKNKCITCPNSSLWNGTGCIKKVAILAASDTKSTIGQNTIQTTSPWSSNSSGSDLKIEDAWSVVRPNSKSANSVGFTTPTFQEETSDPKASTSQQSAQVGSTNSTKSQPTEQTGTSTKTTSKTQQKPRYKITQDQDSSPSSVISAQPATAEATSKPSPQQTSAQAAKTSETASPHNDLQANQKGADDTESAPFEHKALARHLNRKTS